MFICLELEHQMTFPLVKISIFRMNRIECFCFSNADQIAWKVSSICVELEACPTNIPCRRNNSAAVWCFFQVNCLALFTEGEEGLACHVCDWSYLRLLLLCSWICFLPMRQSVRVKLACVTSRFFNPFNCDRFVFSTSATLDLCKFNPAKDGSDLDIVASFPVKHRFVEWFSFTNANDFHLPLCDSIVNTYIGRQW